MQNLAAFEGSKSEGHVMMFQIVLGAIVCITYIAIAIYTRKTMAPLLKQMCVCFCLTGLFWSLASYFW